MAVKVFKFLVEKYFILMNTEDGKSTLYYRYDEDNNYFNQDGVWVPSSDDEGSEDSKYDKYDGFLLTNV